MASPPFLYNVNAALPTPCGLYLSNLCGDLLAHTGATQTFDFDRWQRIMI